MSFEGVKINRLNGGLGGENDNEDGVFLLVASVASVPGSMNLHEAYPLLGVKDADAMMLNASYDANEGVLVYHAVERFFQLSPEGKLYLMLTDALTALAVMTSNDFKAGLRQVPSVKGIGIMGATDTVTSLYAAVEQVQSVVTIFKGDEHRLIDFVVIGAGGLMGGASLNISAYPDMRSKDAPNISVSIAQDPDVANLSASYSNYADVGSVLGMLAVRGVNENLGSVDINRKPSGRRGDRDYSLSDAGSGSWMSASLSDGKRFSSLSSAEKKALTSKGYIYAGSFEGYGGVFFNSSPTAVEKASDYAYIERNRVWNKAARAIRTALIPEVRRTVKKDPSTGYIRSTTITRWTGIVKKVLERMEAADEISGYAVYIDPKQVLSESSPLRVKASVVSDDIVHEFEIDLGLTKQV